MFLSWATYNLFKKIVTQFLWNLEALPFLIRMKEACSQYNDDDGFKAVSRSLMLLPSRCGVSVPSRDSEHACDCYDGCSVKEVTLRAQGRPSPGLWELPPDTPCRSPAVTLWEAQATWRGHRRHCGHQSHPVQGPGRWVKNPPGKLSLQLFASPPAVQVSSAEVTDIMELRPASPAVACPNPWCTESVTIIKLFNSSKFGVTCYAAVESGANDHSSYHSMVPSTCPAWYYTLLLYPSSLRLLCKIY